MKKVDLRKSLALMLMLATVFVMLFSTAYLVKHVNHNCTGTECPVCEVMVQCENNIRTIATAIILAVVAGFVFSTISEKVSESDTFFFCNSLVSQKIRMNN